MPHSLRSIAERVEADLHADPDVTVSGVAPLDTAGPSDISLVVSTRYADAAGSSAAAAVLVGRKLVDRLPDGTPHLAVDDPHAALRLVLLALYPETSPQPGVHPTAVVDESAELAKGVSVGPFSVIEEGAVLGDGVVVSSHARVGRGSRVGARTLIHAHVTLYPGTELGRDCIIHSGCRLGADGFGYVFTGGRHEKVPQVGGCRIGDEVEIGANSTVDRGSIGDTVVGSGSKIDNLVHIGHNVRIGERVIVVAQVGVSGSTTVGEGVVLGGQAGIGGHLSIGPGARVGAQAGVTADVPAGQTVSGYPARPHREALRAQAALFRLPELLRRLREGEKTGDGES